MIDTMLGRVDHLLHRRASIPNSLKDFGPYQLSTEWSLGSEIAHGGVATVHNVTNRRGSLSPYIIKLFTPNRGSAETEFLTHLAALIKLNDSGFIGIAPKLVD